MTTMHKNVIDMIAVSRTYISDELALNTIEAFPKWETLLGKSLDQKSINDGKDRYQYNGKLYQLIQPHTPQADWTPDVTPALWKEVSLEEWPEWKQPAGAHDAYKKDDKVTHNGKKWISTVDANVWEPSVHGWSEVTT